jgi:6-pyruvoyltetrahydropterin/6-carboxytetrahydropterin synthase
MYQITKQLKPFSAAHRIVNGYPGKCHHLHGHNYDLSISFESSTLNQYGFVIDFDDITRFFDDWVQKNWDHCTLVSTDDTGLLDFVVAHQQKHYVFPNDRNTTVENLAQHLFERMREIMNGNPGVFRPGLVLKNITLWETKTSMATVSE